MRLAFVLLLSMSFANDATLTRVQVHGKASVWLDRPANDPLSVKLSEKLTIVMRVEGDSPLDVELTAKVRSNAGWHLEAVGKPTMMPCGDGKQSRWERRFLAIPLQPGPQPLPLPALQFTEKGGPEQQVSWEPLKLTVTTRVAKVDPSEIRDRIGIEELPPLPAAQPWWPWTFLALPVLVFTGLVIWRRRGRVVVEPDPAKIALEELKARREYDAFQCGRCEAILRGSFRGSPEIPGEALPFAGDLLDDSRVDQSVPAGPRAAKDAGGPDGTVRLGKVRRHRARPGRVSTGHRRRKRVRSSRLWRAPAIDIH